MEYDLWGPAYDQVTQEDRCCMQSEWQYGLYFDCRSDVMEVNALNEKSCAQVLRKLIAQADREIGELEDNMMCLQNQLVWTEFADWRDVCDQGNTLIESAATLRDGTESYSEFLSPMHRGPPERLHAVVRTLLRKHYEAKEKTTHDVTAPDWQSDSGKCSSEQLDEEVKPGDLVDDGVIMSGDLSGTTPNSNRGSVSSKIQDITMCETEKTSRIVKLSTDVLKDSSICERKRNSADSGLVVVKEEIEHHVCLTMADNTVGESPKKSGLCEDYKKLQSKETLVKGSTTRVNGLRTRHWDEIKNVCHSHSQPDVLGNVGDCRIMEAGKREHSATSPDIEPHIWDSASKAEVKQCQEDRKATSSEKMHSSNSSTEERNTPLQADILQAVLTASECSVSTSFVYLQDETGKNRSISLDSQYGRSKPPEEAHVTGITPATTESILKIPIDSAKLRTGMTAKMNLESSKRPGLGPTKGQQICCNSGCPDEVSRKEMKKQQEQFEAGKLIADVQNCQKTVKRLRKNRELAVTKATTAYAPLMESSEGRKESLVSEVKNNVPKKESCSGEGLGTVAVRSHLAAGNLKDLKMSDLRALAKGRKLTNYYKLKKNDLLELLTNQLNSS